MTRRTSLICLAFINGLAAARIASLGADWSAAVFCGLSLYLLLRLADQ